MNIAQDAIERAREIVENIELLELELKEINEILSKNDSVNNSIYEYYGFYDEVIF